MYETSCAFFASLRTPSVPPEDREVPAKLKLHAKAIKEYRAWARTLEDNSYAATYGQKALLLWISDGRPPWEKCKFLQLSQKES